jgi:hypothetical protein
MTVAEELGRATGARLMPRASGFRKNGRQPGEQAMAVDDGGGEVDELAVIDP